MKLNITYFGNLQFKGYKPSGIQASNRILEQPYSEVCDGNSLNFKMKDYTHCKIKYQYAGRLSDEYQVKDEENV